jgi:peptide/nickel transport system substrate-binding protein
VKRNDIQPRRRLHSRLFTDVLWALFILNLFLLAVLLQALLGVAGIVVTEFGLILLPCLFYISVTSQNPVEVLRLKPFSARTLLGSLALVFATVTLAAALLMVQEYLFPSSEEVVRALQQLLGDLSRHPFLLVLAFAVTPGICEEVLFRGVLLYKLERQFGFWPSIVLTAVIFGAFHFSRYRFVGPTLLGVVLAFVTLRANSIFPSMLIHSGYNAVIVLSSITIGEPDIRPENLTLGMREILALSGSTALAVILLVWGLKLIRPGGKGPRLLLLLPLFFFLSLQSCGREDRAPGILTVAIEAPPMNLDPRVGTDAASEHIDQLLFNGLVTRDEKLEIRPDLAESWEQPDETTYVFHLRRGVRFHNGRECGCEDVRYTLESIASGAVLSARKKVFSAVERIECPDVYTVVLKLREPNSAFLTNLKQGIVPRGAKEDFGEHPVGTGPFRWGHFLPAGGVYLEAAADHFRGPPAARGLMLRVIPDEVVRCLELEKGTVDIAINNISPDMTGTLAKRKNLKILSAPGSNYNYIGFNLDDPVLKHHAVREAIALGIDREALIRYLLRGAATPATGILPPASPFYNPRVRTYPYDPERARLLLDMAGFPDPDGDGPRSRLTLTYKTSTDKTAGLQAMVIQEQLARVGIAIKVRSYEFSTFYSDIKKGNFQIYSLRWVGVSDPEIFEYVFYSRSIPPAGANRGRYRNPTIDAAIEAGRRTFDERKRKAVYDEIQAIAAEDLPYVSLWYPANIVVTQREIEGFAVLPGGDFTPLKDTFRTGFRSRKQSISLFSTSTRG